MLRVINQERSNAQAWDLYLQGAGKKGEAFRDYARRIGAEARTPEPTSIDRDRVVAAVKQKLGAFYRPPVIQA